MPAERPPLIVAAAQPPCVAGDMDANARAHADALLAADARLVVFPELSLTGYDLRAAAVDPGDPALAPIVAACARARAVALVGAPVQEGGAVFIATLRVDRDGASVAYRKSFLGDDEQHRFSPGPGATAIALDGWRVGLGICKDTGVAQHVRDTAALDVDLYAAGVVHHDTELEEQEVRGERIARACGAPVVLASFAGATGEGYAVTAGCSAIWSPDGGVLARAGIEPGAIARATLRSLMRQS